MTHTRSLRSAALALAIFTSGIALASSPAAGVEPEKPSPAAEGAEAERATPRAAMRAYLAATRDGDYADAADWLNLSRIPAAERAERGPELARELKIVLDRKLWVELDALSNETAGESDDGLPAGRDLVGTIESPAGPVPILLERVPDAAGGRDWQIAASTVARVPQLYEEYGYGRLGEWLPGVFFEEQFLEVQLWQWLGMMVLVVSAWFASWLLVRAGASALRALASRSSTTLDDQLVEHAVGPVRLVVAVLMVSAGSYALGLSVPAQEVVNAAARTLGIVAATWLALRAIDMGSELAELRLLRDQVSARQFVPLGRKTVKAAAVAIAVLAALDSFGFDVTALIAGLGIGGLAVALALQKTLENLFGGATILVDRPVRVGDFCRFGDRVGTVEEIGMRSTRIRTLDRTVVTVPNAEFATTQLENFNRRDKIWYHPTIGLRYETTPEQLRYVLIEVRKMLYAHPKVDPDPARIRFTSFGAYSLDLEIFAYVEVTDFGEFLEVAEDLNLRVMDIVAEAGTGFAFPSSTTYLAHDEGLDAERAGAAEEAVKGWRAQRELYLPAFPRERIDELADTLDYPPEGSPLRG